MGDTCVCPGHGAGMGGGVEGGMGGKSSEEVCNNHALLPELSQIQMNASVLLVRSHPDYTVVI